MKAEAISRTMHRLSNPADAISAQRFFKTGKGEYGEGDIFLGIRVPQIRNQVKTFRGTALPEIRKLLESKYHEIRLLALLMMVDLFQRSEQQTQKTIFSTYLSCTAFINNWDLVDLSADKIVGAWLLNRDKAPLYQLAKSELLWERRIAILATFHFIRNGRFDTTMEIADLLLNDGHDLIHKAVGWMLRETGNRDLATEETFLKSRYKNMPRTMLRYAIEKFPAPRRQAYLKSRI
ncbi:MAG: DNA alkylation repair protein [Kiritimatiellales bacterium]|nr:DNA alkylation repair protein [Kiritimatiellales bacterium]